MTAAPSNESTFIRITTHAVRMNISRINFPCSWGGGRGALILTSVASICISHAAVDRLVVNEEIVSSMRLLWP